MRLALLLAALALLSGCVLPVVPRPDRLSICPSVDLRIIGEAEVCLDMPVEWPDKIREMREERQRQKEREDRFRREWFEREQHAARVLT